MKHEQSDIQFLITILSLFIVSVALLHSSKGSKAEMKTMPVEVTTGEDVTLSTQNILDTIQPYVMSRSITTLAKILSQFSSAQMLETVTHLIKDDENLSSLEKVQLVLALTSLYTTDTDAQYALFDLFVQMRNYLGSHPILLIAARSENPAIIEAIRTWAQQHSSQFVNEELFAQWTDAALDQAVATNDLAALELLYLHGIRPTVKKASSLLVQVAQKNRDPRFVPFLVSHGANVNEVVNKRTPLMYAIENRNKEMAKALLDAEADPNKLIDVQTGTALQLAFERGYSELEELLRKYGAQ